MFLPVYLLAAGVAAGLFGAFGRMVFADFGYVPDFESGIALAVAIAAVYLTLQFGWMALLQLLYPTRANAPLLLDALSQGAIVALVPYLIGYTFPLPHEKLYEVEPLLYLGAFIFIHTLLKLISFFAMIQAEAAVRWRMLYWAAACAVVAVVARESFFSWKDTLSAPRTSKAQLAEPFRSGEVQAMARPLREGILLPIPVNTEAGGQILLRWADPAASDKLGTLFVTIEPQGFARRSWTEQVELKPQGWSAMRIPVEDIPDGTTELNIVWGQAQEAPWVTQTGLRPMSDSTREVLVSGPFRHVNRTDSGVPNMLVIGIDGLAADHVTSLGYAQPTTPQLDSLASASLRFDNAFTPAPEAIGAYMSILTGLDPLAHGYLGRYRGALPKAVKTLPEFVQERGYITAGFSEGAHPEHPDLTADSEFARGFELFDDSYRMSYPAGVRVPGSTVAAVPDGSQITLSKASTWIEQRGDAPWFAFVRLRELENPMRLDRYGKSAFGSGSNPTAVDTYDTALAWMDQQIGAFLTGLNDAGALDNTCIVVTSPYGLEFSGSGNQTGAATLSEASLRIPLMLRLPETPGRGRLTLAGLEDIAPTLVGLLGAEFDYPVSGVSLTRFGGTEERVAMNGDPVVLSVRDRQWRFTWLAGRNPSSFEKVTGETPLALYSVNRRAGESGDDQLRTRPDLAQKYTTFLRDWMRQHLPAGS